MAIIKFDHTRYQITRVIVLPAGAQNGKPGAIRICATELDHEYNAAYAWRADVWFDLVVDAAAKDQRFARYYRFNSWNVGTSLNAPRQVAIIDAALADYIDEIDIDARDAEAHDAELIARADAESDADAAASTPAAHPMRAETINRAIANNVYITDAMVAASHTLRDVAADFVNTYRGFNSFVQNVAVRVADTGVITIPQMRGVLNVMIAEAKADRAALAANTPAAIFADNADGAPYLDLRSANEKTVDDAGEPPAAEDAPQDDRRLPNGTYTIILDAATDEYRTIRLADAPDHFNAAPGTQIAYYLAGADNEGDYIGFAFVIGTSPRIWKKFDRHSGGKCVQALMQLLTSADPMDAMREYVLRSARCGVCGRKLTTPDSIRLGIGPICAGKLAEQGYTFTMPKEARAIVAAVNTIEAKRAEATQPKTLEEKREAARVATAKLNELFDYND